MKEIEDIDLQALTLEAGKLLHEEQRAVVLHEVRRILGAARTLAMEVERMKKAYSRKKEQFEKAFAKAVRLQGGDWAALPEPKDDKPDD